MKTLYKKIILTTKPQGMILHEIFQLYNAVDNLRTESYKIDYKTLDPFIEVWADIEDDKLALKMVMADDWQKPPYMPRDEHTERYPL